MATLTKTGKERLDRNIINVLEENPSKFKFEITEIIELLAEYSNISIDYYTNQNIICSLIRLEKKEENFFNNYSVSTTNNKVVFRTKDLVKINSDNFKKVNEKLYLDTVNKEIYFDFKLNGFFINDKSLNPILKDIYSQNDVVRVFKSHFIIFNNYLNTINIERFFDPTYRKLLQEYEWIFNYCNDFETSNEFLFFNSLIPKKCPKGLINYLSENRLEFNYENVHNYILINSYGIANFKFIIFCKHFNFRESKIIEMLEKFPNIEKIYSKIIINTLKNNSIDELNLNLLGKLFDNFENITYLDSNRGIKQNIEIISNAENKKLNKKMQEINFINGLIDNSGKYVVVVPQTQQEKQDEGRQQNNCVGYYYDKSILDGRNYIYFIRKVGYNKKSFLTCRYNIEKKSTIESRFKNNIELTNEEENLKNFIKIIDNIIQKNLKLELDNINNL